MSSGLIVILVFAALGVVALIAMRRRKDSDTDGRYLVERPGIAGLHVHPSIPRATAEQMADLVLAIHSEVWPVILLEYRVACLERKVPAASLHGKWHTTKLQPKQFTDGRWTAYGVSSGIWALAVGCTAHLAAEELHSMARSTLGVYTQKDLYAEAGKAVSSWIRSRWGSS